MRALLAIGFFSIAIEALCSCSSGGCGHGCNAIDCPAGSGQELAIVITDVTAGGDVAIHVCLDSVCDDVTVVSRVASSATLLRTEGRVAIDTEMGIPGGIALLFERGIVPDAGPDTGPPLSAATLVHVTVTHLGGTPVLDRTMRAGDGATGCQCPNYLIRL